MNKKINKINKMKFKRIFFLNNIFVLFEFFACNGVLSGRIEAKTCG